MENMEKMPEKGFYLFLVIFGFVIGILWGALSISPYNKLKAAVDSGDYETANANAKKIRTYVIIGVVINAVVIVVRKMYGF